MATPCGRPQNAADLCWSGGSTQQLPDAAPLWALCWPPFPASANIFVRSRWNAMPVAVRCAKTLRLSRGSVFRRTRSNSERRSRARVMAGLDTLSLAANPRTVCASSSK